MKYSFNISSTFEGNIKSYDVDLSARYEQTLQEFALSLLSTYLNSYECNYDASCVWCIRVARDIAKDCRRITVYSDAKDFGTDEYRLLGSRGVVGKGIKWYWQLLLLRRELEYDK